MCDQADWAYTLTPMGTIVWEFCDGQNQVESIVSSVARVSQQEMTPALADEVHGLLKELDELGLFAED